MVIVKLIRVKLYCVNNLIKDLDKKTVLILGAGRTGLAAVNFLATKAKTILLSDSKSKPTDFDEKVKTIKNIEFEFNKNSEEFINRADFVVISPGISPKSEIVKKLLQKGLKFVSDIELGSRFTKKPTIGITGTNGKTTTTSLVTHLINTSGQNAIACGNIGKPFLEALEEDNEKTNYFVLEISSFQIYYSPSLACQIAACLNITPDHLDWHIDFNDYVKTKEMLFKNQNDSKWAVLNFSDPLVKKFNTTAKKFFFSCNPLTKEELNHLDYCAFYKDGDLFVKEGNTITKIINKKELKIIGSHNIENALAGIAVARIVNLTVEDIYNGLKSFSPVEHRLEFVRRNSNKVFYNDSKATNPEATIKAIEAIGEENSHSITLILGGRDKNTSLAEMVKAIKTHIKEVILFGEAKERFQTELKNSGFNDLIVVTNLQEALEKSLQSKTDTVLFSPACASFDMFKNYEERGRIFKEIVNKL